MTCGWDQCDRTDIKGLGLCGKHYALHRRTGKMDATPRRRKVRTPTDVFAMRIHYTDTCWLWTGALNKGYGKVELGGGDIPAHRWVYETLVGPIPAGLDLDHLCHNDAACPGGPTCPHRRCVNPAHLRPATRGQNLSAGAQARARANPRTTCANGHDLTGENATYLSGGRIRCRECRRATQRRRDARRKERAADADHRDGRHP